MMQAGQALWARWARGAAVIAWPVLAQLGCDPDPRFDPACPSGTEGCPCLPDGSCDEDEGQCLEDVCVVTEVDEPIPPQKEGTLEKLEEEPCEEEP